MKIGTHLPTVIKCIYIICKASRCQSETLQNYRLAVPLQIVMLKDVSNYINKHPCPGTPKNILSFYPLLAESGEFVSNVEAKVNNLQKVLNRLQTVH